MVNQRSKIIYCSWEQEVAWLVDDIEPIDPAITDDGPAFDVQHGDEWEEEGALTDSDNDDDEEEREE